MVDIEEQVDIEVCDDCIALLANGEVIDGDGEDIADAVAQAQLDKWPAPWRLVPGVCEDCESSFFWSPCDGCGSSDGGARHVAHALLEAPRN